MNPYPYPTEYFMNPYYDYPPEEFNLIPNEFYGAGYHHLFYGGPAGTLYPYSNFQIKPFPLYQRRSFLESPKNNFARDFYIENQSNFHKRSAESLLKPPTIFMSSQNQDVENTQAENLNSVNVAATNANTFQNSKDKESSNTMVHQRDQSQSSMMPRIIFSSSQSQDIENSEASNFNQVEMSANNNKAFANSKDKESGNTIMINKRDQPQSSNQKRFMESMMTRMFSSSQSQDIENSEASNLNNVEMSAINTNTFASSKDKESGDTMIFNKRDQPQFSNQKRLMEPLMLRMFSTSQLQDIENKEASNLNKVELSATNTNTFASSKDKESGNTLIFNKRGQAPLTSLIPHFFSSNQLKDIENTAASTLNKVEMAATNSNTFAKSKNKESANTIMFHKRNQSQPSDKKRLIFSSDQSQDIENAEASNLKKVEMSATNTNTFAKSKDKESGDTMIINKRILLSSNQLKDIENLEAANFGTVEMSANNANALQSSKNKESSNTMMIHKRNHLKSSDQERSIFPNSQLGFFSNQNKDLENTEATNFNTVEMSATNSNALQSSKDKESSNTIMINKREQHETSNQERSDFFSNQNQDLENIERNELLYQYSDTEEVKRSEAYHDFNIRYQYFIDQFDNFGPNDLYYRQYLETFDPYFRYYSIPFGTDHYSYFEPVHDHYRRSAELLENTQFRRGNPAPITTLPPLPSLAHGATPLLLLAYGAPLDVEQHRYRMVQH
ncbi:hypothetical protein F8M41_008115 [Gigaspora margarita]|uniref:Uncharacterized protein n=1 Tax=Gigaspora margarita TaxID=4874 RepID=A0A8H4A2K7_GIGMA|nr:hypothetical protein F8M41_008115 [Gigaspora margarita]